MSLPSLSSFILVTHWVLVIVLSLRVIMRRPPTGVAIAWLMVIFSLPYAGAVLYLMFGEKRLGRTRAARIAANVESLERRQAALWQEGTVNDAKSVAALSLERHAERMLGFPALRGNRIELIQSYDAIFDSILSDIERAHEKIHLSFYTWQEGGRTKDVVDALVNAAQRGVRCRALADAMGSMGFLDGGEAKRLRDAGVEFVAALPTGPLRTLFVRLDLRNHRKIVVIDDLVAYTGSQNMVDPRFFKQDSGVGQWVDAMARITGPAVSSLDGVFQLDWAVETGQAFEAPPTSTGGNRVDTGTQIQIVPSGPDLHPEAIHQLLLTAIYGATRELIITTPYFVPEESIMTAMISAALRGVQVTLIVPAHNDSGLVRYASAAHYDDLVNAGAKIARFEGGLLHTKSLTIDGEISLFGSVNLDIRSLWLNFEISLIVCDPDFTLRLRALQNSYLDDSDLLDLETWRRRPAWHRFLENTVRLVSPLL